MTKFEINHNIDAEEGLPDTEMARKFQEAVKKKKTENNPDYKGDNPETSEEVIHDLGVFGVYGELEKKVEEPKPQEHRPFTRKDAEDLTKASFSKDVFEREEKGGVEIKVEQPEIESRIEQSGNFKKEELGKTYQELDRLGKELVDFKKKAKKTKDEEVKKACEKEIELIINKREKLKLQRDSLKEGIEIEKQKKPKKTESGDVKFKYEDAIDKQIKDLGDKLKIAEENTNRVKRNKGTKEQIEERQRQAEVFEKEIEKAKEARVRAIIKSKGIIGFADNKKTIITRSQVQADISENQLETYGKGILTNKSTPEDLKEFIDKEKEIKREQETQKENVLDLTTSKSRQEEINKVWQKEVLNNEKEGEKFDLTTPEGRQKEIERVQQEEAEKLLTAADKQEEKIEEEIKQEKSWIREKVEKTANWYKKQPLWKKVLFSFSCIGVASASATLGGAAGATIAAAAFTGSIGQRALGGLATFITVEGVLKKSAEKGGKERTKAEAARHTVEAAVLGLLVGSGQFARGVKEIADVTGASDLLKNAYEFWIPKSEIKIMPSIKMSPEEFHNRYPGLKYSAGIEDTDIKLKSAIGVEAAQPEAPAAPGQEIKVGTLIIGARGPEGAIIDYFRENPDIAVEKFGCPKELYGPNGEITDLDKFNEWAGGKAHRLWLEDAKEALTKPETLGKLKELGYPQDAEGYAKMMHRIGKGSVELDFKTGKIDLVDTEYLKTRIDTSIDDGGGETDNSGNEPAKEPTGKLGTKETTFNDVQNWLENKAKIDVKKSSWLTEKFLGNYKVGEILDPGFAKPQGVEAYTTAEPEYGSPQWWELKEKAGLQNQAEKILRNIPIGERAGLRNMSLLDFFKKYLAK